MKYILGLCALGIIGLVGAMVAVVKAGMYMDE